MPGKNWLAVKRNIEIEIKERKVLAGKTYLLTALPSILPFKTFVKLDFSFREKVIKPAKSTIETDYPILFTSYIHHLSKEEIFAIAYEELNKFMGISREEITTYKVIKEKRATFIPSNNVLGSRPETETKIKNLFLAGDWIETGLPSTIESAVKSGRMAADLIINHKQ